MLHIWAGHKLITVSIVSHRHGGMVARLVAQLNAFPEVHRIVVTLNVPECLELHDSWKTVLIENRKPAGFAANHNAAYRWCDTEYFCVVNPDIDCHTNPFPTLLKALVDPEAGVVAPMLRDTRGKIETSARRFPTVWSLMLKLAGRSRNDYLLREGLDRIYPEWVGGMFMLFRSKDYIKFGMFSEIYYMYYEDVDLCLRISRKNKKVVLCLECDVVHDARRYSHKYWSYRWWHLKSMALFFIKRYLSKFSS